MMGRLKSDQGQLLYGLHLSTRFPKIIWCGRSMLLSIFHGFAANLHLIIRPRVAQLIDPELIIRMLVVGCVFAIRSERLICR
jgi:hypothetical protein